MGKEKPSTCRTLNEFERGYISALIESEGWIGKRTIIIVNTDKALLDFARKTLGCGKVYCFKHPELEDGHHKTRYDYVIRVKADVLRILEQIEPYLFGKKVKAQQEMARLRKSLLP